MNRLHGQRTEAMWVAGALLAVLFVIGGIGIVIGSFAKAPADPVARPSPVPSVDRSAAASFQSLANASLTVRVPSGWEVNHRDDSSFEFVGPKHDGLVFLLSQKRDSPQTVAQAITDYTGTTQRKYPDVRTCLDPTPLPANGPIGSVFALCYTFIPQAGPAYPAVDLFWMATNPKANTLYLYEVFAPADGFNDFRRSADPVLQSVQWKLT